MWFFMLKTLMLDFGAFFDLLHSENIHANRQRCDGSKRNGCKLESARSNQIP